MFDIFVSDLIKLLILKTDINWKSILSGSRYIGIRDSEGNFAEKTDNLEFA